MFEQIWSIRSAARLGLSLRVHSYERPLTNVYNLGIEHPASSRWPIPANDGNPEVRLVEVINRKLISEVLRNHLFYDTIITSNSYGGGNITSWSNSSTNITNATVSCHLLGICTYFRSNALPTAILLQSVDPAYYSANHNRPLFSVVH